MGNPIQQTIFHGHSGFGAKRSREVRKITVGMVIFSGNHFKNSAAHYSAEVCVACQFLILHFQKYCNPEMASALLLLAFKKLLHDRNDSSGK